MLHIPRRKYSSSESTVKLISACHCKGNNGKTDNKDFKNKRFNVSKIYENVKFNMKSNVDDNYVCFCCDKVNNHYVNKCRLKNVICNSCKDRGH